MIQILNADLAIIAMPGVHIFFDVTNLAVPDFFVVIDQKVSLADNSRVHGDGKEVRKIDEENSYKFQFDHDELRLSLVGWVIGSDEGHDYDEGEDGVDEDEAGNGLAVAFVEEEEGYAFAWVAEREVVFQVVVVIPFCRDFLTIRVESLFH